MKKKLESLSTVAVPRLVRFLPFSVSLGGNGFPPFIIDRRKGGFRIIKIGLIPLFDWRWWRYSLRHQSFLATVLRLGHVPDERIEAANTCAQHESPSCVQAAKGVASSEDVLEVRTPTDPCGKATPQMVHKSSPSVRSGRQYQDRCPHDASSSRDSQTPTTE